MKEWRIYGFYIADIPAPGMATFIPGAGTNEVRHVLSAAEWENHKRQTPVCKAVDVTPSKKDQS